MLPRGKFIPLEHDMKTTRIYLVAALLAGGAAFMAAASLPSSAMAQAAAPSSPPGAPGWGGGEGWGGHGRHHFGPAALFRRLGLSDVQKASVKSILQTNGPALRSLHEQTRANSLKLRNTAPNDPNYASVVAEVSQANAGLLTQEITLQANVRAQLFNVLTSPQQAQLAALEAQMQARMQAHMAEHAGQAPPPPAP
jgi:Spy/CpxP family protein refolding chaperone